MTLAMSGATPEDSGLASGLVNTSMQVGGAIGLAVLATLSTERTQSLLDDGVSNASALTSGYHVAYLIGAGLAAIAVAIAVFVLRDVAPAAPPRRPRAGPSGSGEPRGPSPRTPSQLRQPWAAERSALRPSPRFGGCRRRPPALSPSARHGALALGALGIVFGDIGTSPLYALQTVFSADHQAVKPTEGDVYGVISLVFWSITLIVSVKFVLFIMRADNDGEGGILALIAHGRGGAAAQPARSRRC